MSRDVFGKFSTHEARLLKKIERAERKQHRAELISDGKMRIEAIREKKNTAAELSQFLSTPVQFNTPVLVFGAKK